jgi:hypothetical protein
VFPCSCSFQACKLTYFVVVINYDHGHVAKLHSFNPFLNCIMVIELTSTLSRKDLLKSAGARGSKVKPGINVIKLFSLAIDAQTK